MNVVEHWIIKVHNVEDATKEYEEIVSRKSEQPVFKIDITVDCYGQKRRKTEYFLKAEWDKALEQGFYLA